VPETRMGITTGPNQTADSAIASLFVFGSGHDLLRLVLDCRDKRYLAAYLCNQALGLFGAGKLINDETDAKPGQNRAASFSGSRTWPRGGDDQCRAGSPDPAVQKTRRGAVTPPYRRESHVPFENESARPVRISAKTREGDRDETLCQSWETMPEGYTE
jgi:hypothetical protein